MPTIVVDLKQIDKLSVEFIAFPTELKRAVRNSINQALNSGQKAIAVEVKKEYAIRTQRAARSKIKLKRATLSNLNGELEVTDKRIQAKEFSHNAQKFGGIGRTGTPLKLEIKKGQKISSRHMFMPYKTGSTAQPRGRGIYLHNEIPIKGMQFDPVFTISVPQMVRNDEVYDGISKEMEKTYYKQHEYWHDRLIREAQARISG